jgi:polar amino acid transport system substrate-binding protein
MKIRNTRNRYVVALAASAMLLALSGCSTAPAATGTASAGASSGDTTPTQSCNCLADVTVNAAARDLLPDSIKASGVLRAGFNAPSPPFWYIDTSGSGSFSGVEHDMIQALGKALDLKVELTNQAWDGLMPALTAGRYDVIISNIADKPERRENINFVDYGKTGTGLLVLDKNAAKYKSRADMCGTTIGTQTGAAQVGMLEDISAKECAGKDPINIKSLSDLKGLFPALISGQIDSLALDSPAVAYWANLKQEGTPKYATVLNNLQDASLKYGLGVNNKEPEIAKALQEALKGLDKAGTFQKIWDTGNIGDLTIHDFTINGKPEL